ncbi:hypothetical protein WICMUC_002346 [Wickerhamomyces mucosus]|uniref:Magnesium-dependent phosphatase-1 n=1 Tax=Wickerhamomyces mucosus TaxID=1378264 RepID=A0A9P8PRL4_9ASCO|nr:hypothetical protein WICMUC_002346 [Wickerhamomyces mucosus]
MTKLQYPKVVIFDLDYTLWPCWCDTHISPPIKAKNKQEITDKYGTSLSFFPDVEVIFKELLENNVLIVGASRTHAPQVATKLLKLLHINGEPAINHFSFLEWGTGSKIGHINSALKKIRQELGVDVSGHDCILYDDEYRNKDVRTIGVQFAYLPNEELNYSLFREGLEAFSIKSVN